MKTAYTARLAALLLMSVALVGSHGIATAQIEKEAIEIPVGSIFEMLGSANGDTDFNWVLTMNGEFMEASRDTHFRTRFSKTGTYELATEAAISDNNRVRRIFEISVRQRQPDDTRGPLSDTASNVIAITPTPQQETIVMRNQEVAAFTPQRSDVRVFAIDLNTNVDSNGDGNASNDDDTRATLFRNEGNPLHVWFVNGAPRTVRIGALFENNQTYFETYSIANTPPPAKQSSSASGSSVNVFDTSSDSQNSQTTTSSGSAVSSSSTTDEQPLNNIGEVVISSNDNGKVEFSTRLTPPIDDPLLYQWSFGDGQQSLLDKPIHTYAESGQYTVTVEVRNLQSGEIIGQIRDTVQVNRLQIDTPDTAGDTSGNTEDDDQEPVSNNDEDDSEGGGSSFLGIIGKILLILLIFGAIGFVLILVLKAMQGKGFSLQKTIEKADEKFAITPDTPEDTPTEAPPMEIVDEPTEQESVETPQVTQDTEPTPPVIEQETPQPAAASEPTPPEPTPQQAPDTATPDWLQPSSSENTSPEPASAAPEPAAPVEEPQPTPSPQPVEQTPVAPEQPTTPPTQADTPATQEPTPSPEPTPPTPIVEAPPVDIPAPNVSHTAMQPTVDELEVDKDKAPAWLQAGVEEAEAKGQTAAAPPPEPLQNETTTNISPESTQTTPPATTPPPAELNDAERETKLREKKRRKRQRYRENLKRRKAESNNTEPNTNESAPSAEPDSNNEPVAYIQAEGLDNAGEPKPPQEQPPSPPEERPIEPQEPPQNQ